MTCRGANLAARLCFVCRKVENTYVGLGLSVLVLILGVCFGCCRVMKLFAFWLLVAMDR